MRQSTIPVLLAEKHLESAKRLRTTQNVEEPQKKSKGVSLPKDDTADKPLVQWENERYRYDVICLEKKIKTALRRGQH